MPYTPRTPPPPPVGVDIGWQQCNADGSVTTITQTAPSLITRTVMPDGSVIIVKYNRFYKNGWIRQFLPPGTESPPVCNGPPGTFQPPPPGTPPLPGNPVPPPKVPRGSKPPAQVRLPRGRTGRIIREEPTTRIIRSTRNSCVNWVGLAEAIYGILTDYADEREACRRAREHLRDALDCCLANINDALASMVRVRDSLTKVANDCKLSAACRQRLTLLYNLIATAIRRMSEIARNTSRLADTVFNMSCGGDDPGGLPGVPATGPPIHANPFILEHIAGEAEKLCEQCQDAFKTSQLWEAEATDFRSDCGCKKSPWDPIEIPEERRHGDDKFWGGTPTGWKEE